MHIDLDPRKDVPHRPYAILAWAFAGISVTSAWLPAVRPPGGTYNWEMLALNSAGMALAGAASTWSSSSARVDRFVDGFVGSMSSMPFAIEHAVHLVAFAPAGTPPGHAYGLAFAYLVATLTCGVLAFATSAVCARALAARFPRGGPLNGPTLERLRDRPTAAALLFGALTLLASDWLVVHDVREEGNEMASSQSLAVTWSGRYDILLGTVFSAAGLLVSAAVADPSGGGGGQRRRPQQRSPFVKALRANAAAFMLLCGSFAAMGATPSLHESFLHRKFVSCFISSVGSLIGASGAAADMLVKRRHAALGAQVLAFLALSAAAASLCLFVVGEIRLGAAAAAAAGGTVVAGAENGQVARHLCSLLALSSFAAFAGLFIVRIVDGGGDAAREGDSGTALLEVANGEGGVG